jgi:hypothetical protein
VLLEAADARKLICVKAGPAYQDAVYLIALQESSDVIGLDGTAVENPGISGF